MSIFTEIKQIKSYCDALVQEPDAVLYAVVLEQHAAVLRKKVMEAQEVAATLGLSAK